MANFDNSTTKANSVRNANNFLANVRAAYASLKMVVDCLALYQSGTDPVFNGAINALFNSAERTELGTISGKMATLVQDLETNHTGAISQ